MTFSHFEDHKAYVEQHLNGLLSVKNKTRKWEFYIDKCRESTWPSHANIPRYWISQVIFENSIFISQKHVDYLAIIEFFRWPVHYQLMHSVLDSKHRHNFLSIQACQTFKEGFTKSLLLCFSTLYCWRKLEMVSCKYTPRTLQQKKKEDFCRIKIMNQVYS